MCSLYTNCSELHAITPFPLPHAEINVELNKEIETREFIVLAAHFDCLEIFMEPLGLIPAQQADVRNRQFLNGTQVAIAECLSLWQRSNPSAATYRALVKLLLRMRKYDIASKVVKHCQEKLLEHKRTLS